MRAQPLAIFTTDCLHGHRQQHLLAQHIFQKETLPLIVADLSLSRGDRPLRRPSVRALRAIKQIEIALYILPYRFKAACAGQLHRGRQPAIEPDIFYYLVLSVMLFDQLRPALGMQTLHLPEVRPKVDRTRAKLFLKINRMELQLMQFDEHGHLRAPTYMPRRTRKHAQRRKSPGSKLKNKEGAEGCQGDSPQGIGALACTLRQNPKLSQFRHCVDIICGIIPSTNPPA